MKKFINQVELVEDQMIQGMVKAYPQYVRKLECGNVVVRTEKKEGKVALISGGGSGHEPAHGGYVGTGMLDAAVAGAVFTSPTPDQIYEGIKAIATDKGVLMVIKNYTGDVMNFEMAGEMAQMDDIKVAQVVVDDDVAVDGSLYTVGRRGVAGTVFVHKIAGAKAEQGAELEEVQRVAQKVIDNVRTMGVAIRPCTVPAAGKPGFELGEDEMEVGIGIHGEPGTHKEPLRPADEIVDHILDKILSDIDYTGHEVAVMVNSSANVKEPVQQGMWGVFEIFADTIVVCTLTALVILTTGVVDIESGSVLAGVQDNALVGQAFTAAFGSFGPKFIAVSILLFAYSTTLGWSHYGTKAVEYLFGTAGSRIYKVVFVCMTVVGATMKLGLAWDLSDTFNGLMMIPNLIGVLALSGTVVDITRNYFARRVRGEDIEPMWSAFEEYQKEEEAEAAAEEAEPDKAANK